MSVTVPRALGALARKFARLATPQGQELFLRGVARELRPELRKMYATSTDPFGAAWQRRKDGGPAYHSAKMGNAIEVKPAGPSLVISYVVKWIRAADEGHTFPPRGVARESQFLTFDRRGRLIRRDRATYGRGEKHGQARPGVSQTFARSHAIGARVLPARPQEPHGRMPDGWAAALNRGIQRGMEEMFIRSGMERG